MIKQNILIVDDHRENLIALEAILEGPGRNLIMASNGNEALQLLLKHDVSLVLLDVQMPEMDGFEVAELMRNNRKTRQVPIVFVTALSKEQKYVFRGYECGAVDYLFKPIDQQILTAKVNVFLDLDLQRRKLQQAVVQMKRLKDENERLLQAIGEGVIGTDAKGRITFCNDAACTLLNVDRKALQGSNAGDLIFYDDEGKRRWSWEKSPLVRACKKGQSWQSSGELFSHAGGITTMLEINATPINQGQDDFTGTVILLRDITGQALTLAEYQARESRRFKRKKIVREMVLFDRETGGNVGRLLNISTDGFKLFTRSPVEEGRRMALSMVLPEQMHGVNTMSFDARNVWCNADDSENGYHAGFQFLDQTETIRKIVEMLIEKY